MVAQCRRVAIIGAACRLPGGINCLSEFWRVLAAGLDLMTEVPYDRFDMAQLVDPTPLRPGKIPNAAGGVWTILSDSMLISSGCPR